MTENNSNESKDTPREIPLDDAQNEQQEHTPPTSEQAENPPPAQPARNLQPQWPNERGIPTHNPSQQSSSQQGSSYQQHPFQPNQDTFELPSFGQALALLPGHCLKAISQPSSRTFVSLKRYSTWNMVWLLVILSALTTALLASLPTTDNTPSIPISPALLFLLAIPGYFLFAIAQYYIARRLSDTGGGPFVEQCYTSLLPTLPAGIIELLASFIPAVSSAVSFVLGLYTIILNVMALKAVHNIGYGKATLAFLTPIFLLFGLLFLCILCATVAART
ncbi:MAG: YIP1 family protein [Ktedonobacteraceae bacterium]|nr:YIP1 family protein [Ktedonobacteraceae bacterium]